MTGGKTISRRVGRRRRCRLLDSISSFHVSLTTIGLDVVMANIGGAGECAEAIAQVLVVLDNLREGLYGGLFARSIVHKEADVVDFGLAGTPNDLFHGHVGTSGILRTDIPIYILIAAVAHSLGQTNHRERIARSTVIHGIAAAAWETDDIGGRARILFDDVLYLVEVGKIGFGRFIDGRAVRISMGCNGVTLSVCLTDIF